jgi:hypothetical protein
MKIVISFLLAALSLNSACFAESDLRLVNINELTEEDLIHASQGHSSDLVIEFPESTKLGIRFYLTGNLVHLLDQNRDIGQVQVLQTFYLRFLDEDMIISFDLINWGHFYENLSGLASLTLKINDQTTDIVFCAEIDRITSSDYITNSYESDVNSENYKPEFINSTNDNINFESSNDEITEVPFDIEIEPMSIPDYISDSCESDLILNDYESEYVNSTDEETNDETTNV